MRLIDADAFADFIAETSKRQRYDEIKLHNTLTIADVLNEVIAELKGEGLDGFNNAPTIEPERKWTPVNEKLPEKEDRYLCTVEIRSGNTSGLYIEICTYYKNLYTSEGFFKWEKGLKREENVIAWMPLPEPYMNVKEK